MNLKYVEDIIITGSDNTNTGEHFQTIAIRHNKIDACLDLMKTKKILNLSINSEWGWEKKEKDLNFLQNNQWIEGVCIYDEGVKVDSINLLSNLKRLQLTDKIVGVVNFKNLKKLEFFWGRWNNRQLNNFFDQRELKYLGLSYYKGENLDSFKTFKNLKSLQITYSKVANLNGIKNLGLLHSLKLLKLSMLNNIDEIELLRKNLKEITIIGCKKLYNYDVIKTLELEKIIIGDGNPIKSVRFLESMSVKSGHIGVEVLDKNVDILKVLGITFKKYKGYS